VKALFSERLESVPVTRFHYRLLAVLGLGWMFDSMDILMIGYVLAWLGRPDVWGLSQDLALVTISVGLVGLLVGALASGYIADVWGRKRVFQFTLLVYSVFTALSALSPNILVLMALRFIAGIGMGGELPVVSAMLSEFVPGKVRGRFVVLLESFWAYGAVAAALVGYFVIPNLGWQAAMLIGGLPALLVFLIRRTLPESPRYLAMKGLRDEAEMVVRKVEASAGIPSPALPYRTGSAPSPPSLPFRDLLSRIYRRRTLTLWILWFCITFTYYGIFTWLPTALSVELRSITKGFEYVLIITLAQVPGYLSAAYLVEKLGRRPVLSLYLVLSGAFAYLFGTSTSDLTLMATGSMMSFFNLGAWGVLYTYTPEQYPTRARGTGSGAASAVGRVGGILAPLAVRALSANFYSVFLLNASLLALAAFAMLALGEETKGQTLERAAKEAGPGQTDLPTK